MKNKIIIIAAICTMQSACPVFFGANINPCFSQGMGVNITGNAANSRAMLDVDRVGKGVLIPRMVKADRDTITSVPTSLLIYQTDNTPGYYFYNGTSWVKLFSDNSGWSLTGNAATYSNFLGTTGNTSLRLRTNNIQRLIVDSTGNVGIGTTNPYRTLHVTQPGGATPFLLTTSDFNNTNTGSMFSVEFGASSGNTYTTLNALSSGGTAWNNLRLNSSAVGIGLNPSWKLDVLGDIAVDGIDVIRRDGTQAYLFPWSTGYANNMVVVGGGDTTNFSVTGNTYLGTIYGNVGIGTASPGTNKLAVAGVIAGQSVAGSGDVLLIGNDSKLTDVDVANTAGLYGGQDNTVASIRLGSTGGTLSGYNGNVGIGTPGPESPFHVYAGSAGTVTASIQSDLTVEDDGHAFINLLAPNTNYTGIYFGDQDDNARWEFSTNHGTDKFQIKVSGSEKLPTLTLHFSISL